MGRIDDQLEKAKPGCTCPDIVMMAFVKQLLWGACYVTAHETDEDGPGAERVKAFEAELGHDVLEKGERGAIVVEHAIYKN